MQQKVKEFEEEINQSENPLKLAIQLAIVGNYIDCIAMPTIDDKVLNRLLMQYREIKLMIKFINYLQMIWQTQGK